MRKSGIRFRVSLILIITVAILFSFSCSKKNEDVLNSVGELKAKIIFVMGKAEAIRGDKTIPVVLNMFLGQNDKIKTEDGTVDIMVGGLGLFKIKPNSLVQLANLTQSTKIILKQGKILTVLNKLKKDSTFNVETPTAVAGVRGTSFVVEAEGSQSKIGVLTGVVQVNTVNKKIAVTELNQVEVSEKNIKPESKMAVSTINDVKDIVKIKNIESMNEYAKIKNNLKILALIEANESGTDMDMNKLKDSIKAKEIQDQAKINSENIKNKNLGRKNKSGVSANKNKLLNDQSF